MKKKQILTILLVIGLAVYFTGCTENNDNPNEEKNVLNTRSNMWFYTINEAINAAEKNDELHVKSGIYEEIVLINKEISLISTDNINTTIKGNFTDDAVTITADNVTLEGFTISGGGNNTNTNINAGLDMRSNNNLINNCIFTDNNHYGMYLYGSHNNKISNCTYYNNKDRGLYIYSCEENTVENNSIHDEEYGLYLISATKSVFESNTISDIEHKGVYVGSDSKDNIISDNIIRNCNDGIHVKGSIENTFTENLFINNTKGLYFCCGGSENLVYKNVFFNNIDNSYGYPINTFSYQNQGNFWDDYNGTDEDNDGIGDTPYNIPCATGSCNQDEYPLMNPQ